MTRTETWLAVKGVVYAFAVGSLAAEVWGGPAGLWRGLGIILLANAIGLCAALLRKPS